MYKSRSGFTIVELLIVIVVIGVLAAIVIVAYNGVQQRASNAQRIAAASEWVKAIKAYVTINQKFPTPGSSTFCIGEANVTNFDANADQDCGVSDNLKHNYTPNAAIFNTNVKSVVSSLPTFPGKPVQLTATLKGMGMLLRGETYDPTGENIPNVPTLIYFLEGANQDCVLSPLVTPYAGGDFVKTTAKNSYSSTGTACRIMLDDSINP